jgi:hypothetical protein
MSLLASDRESRIRLWIGSKACFAEYPLKPEPSGLKNCLTPERTGRREFRMGL